MRGRRALGAGAGFTLVEVLAGLFVVALGVAGAAAVQAGGGRMADQGARSSPDTHPASRY